MTPARLHALADVDLYIHEERAKADKRGARKAVPSTNPAADLAALANLST